MAEMKWADGAGSLSSDSDDGVRLWKASGQAIFGGFAIGGGWLFQEEGLASATTSVRGQSWIVGARYQFGSWGIGAGYFHGDSEDLIAIGGKDRHEKWIVDGHVELGPAIILTTGVFAFDLDSEGTVVDNAAGLGGTDNHGWGAITGIKMSF